RRRELSYCMMLIEHDASSIAFDSVAALKAPPYPPTGDTGDFGNRGSFPVTGWIITFAVRDILSLVPDRVTSDVYRRRMLLTAALGFLQVDQTTVSHTGLTALHSWLDSWRGLGAITEGMRRHGFEADLTGG